MPKQAFAVKFVRRADVSQVLTTTFGWRRETASDLAHVDNAFCDVAHRDALCAAVVERACTERLPYERSGGSQKIVAHQHVVAIAVVELCGHKDEPVSDALVGAIRKWGTCLKLAVSSHRAGSTVVACLLVPEAVGMRARSQFDPQYRKKGRTRRDVAAPGSVKPPNASATALVRIVTVPLAVGEGNASGVGSTAMDGQESRGRSDICELARRIDPQSAPMGADWGSMRRADSHPSLPSKA